MGEKGIIVSGEFGNILAREKQGESFELGELLVARTKSGNKMLMQVFDLCYGSQLNQQHLELISGLKLDDEVSTHLHEPHTRTYMLARLKNILTMSSSRASAPKTLPAFFSPVDQVTADDVRFISKKLPSSLHLGELRSGSAALPVPVYIDGRKALSHHMLIVGTTGRGKSVLMSNLLWNATGASFCGMLVLDPHDEYFGRSSFGLKDHPSKNVVYYSLNPPPGGRTLKINLSSILPFHLLSLYDWSDAQRDAMRAYYHTFNKEWIVESIRETPLVHHKFGESTLAVVKRRLLSLLSLEFDGSVVTGRSVFDPTAGKTTVKDIQQELENANTVIVDTSAFSGALEVLLGSLFASRILDRYKRYNTIELQQKPIISIVLEEAPRVLGKDVLERGPNVFSTIAREGRKFNVGLTAITQLPSLIPRDVLANLNTKIILGIELKTERQAIIESAAQDLSQDNRMIASLDKGEAIVSSNFLSFATPIKIPFFSQKELEVKKVPRSFEGFR
jgi:DNA helicase HerA-like ATPase